MYLKNVIMAKQQNIGELTSEFIMHLKKIGRADRTIRDYCQSWDKLKVYMESNNVIFYDKAVGRNFLDSLYGKFNYAKLYPYAKRMYNEIEALGEFQDTGRIVAASKKPPKNFEGSIGAYMTEYIAYRKAAFGSAERTIIGYYHNLHQFLTFLRAKRIDDIQAITQVEVYAFIESINKDKLATKAIFTGLLKGFFTYLHNNDQLPNGLLLVPPRVNYDKSPKLPSTFTIDEISALLKSIDRANPRGKRDYAILLLAIKLGMRSSDIMSLKFENILWEKNLIKFVQKKTGKDIVLPLLPEIGNAIIDYLKYGRPESIENYCFLQAMSPHLPMHYGEVNSLTQQHLARSGIKLKGRKHGPHAFRHSFASRLLQDKTPLPVISEAMGHSRTQSTMIYLRIDIDTLRQCALDVPAIPFSFYPKRGELL